MEGVSYESEEAATTSVTELEKNPTNLEGPSKAILKNACLESGAYWVYFSLNRVASVLRKQR